MRSVVHLLLLTLGCLSALSETMVPLTVGSGAPLRLYLTKRLSKRMNEPVQAKLLESVFAFDREVIPAGAVVTGSVISLTPVSKIKRSFAIINGDFTPLHQAQVQFTGLVLPDGRKLDLHTGPTAGLISIYTPQRPRKSKSKKPASAAPNGGILGTARTQIKDQIQGQINGRTRGVADLVRGPDKRERIEEFLVNKLPYHPQWVRKGTRFDAELSQPLNFGEVAMDTLSLSLLGSQPPPDSVVHARLITPLDSASAQPLQQVEAVISQPLFSADHKLILPEGTRVTGSVTTAHAARFFHRGGQLRFNFQSVTLVPGLAAAAQETPRKTLGVLDAAEGSGKNPIKVDDEGGVKAQESKTRFIAPTLAAIIAMKSLDNDADRRTGGEAERNGGGRTLAGGSGFGLLGALAAQTSRSLSSALGFYGLGGRFTRTSSHGARRSNSTEMPLSIFDSERARPSPIPKPGTCSRPDIPRLPRDVERCGYGRACAASPTTKIENESGVIGPRRPPAGGGPNSAPIRRI